MPDGVKELIDTEQGLVFVSGPINSGKSTTLSAMVNYLNSHKELRIVTLEKPIEFIYTNQKSIVQQREVGKDTPSFKEGLEDCLEASLDVVAVSQIESKIEAEKILELAQQGYLVLVLAGANSALDVILKILSLFDGEEQARTRIILSQVLRAIICQKLIVNKQGGYTMLPEILINNDAVRLSIVDNKLNQINNILNTSVSQGMISFKQALEQSVKQGIITRSKAAEYLEKNEALESISA